MSPEAEPITDERRVLNAAVVATWIEEIGVVDKLIGSTESRVESPGEVAGLAGAARCTNEITKSLREIVRRSVRRWKHRDSIIFVAAFVIFKPFILKAHDLADGCAK